MVADDIMRFSFIVYSKPHWWLPWQALKDTEHTEDIKTTASHDYVTHNI